MISAKPQDSQQQTVMTVPILITANLKYPPVKHHVFKCNTLSCVSGNELIQTAPAVFFSSEECKGHPEFLKLFDNPARVYLSHQEIFTYFHSHPSHVHTILSFLTGGETVPLALCGAGK